MTLAQLGRKAGGSKGGHAAQSFLGEVDGNSESRFFNEEALHLVHGPDMLLNISGIDALAVGANAVEVLINIRHAILPDLILPVRRRQLVFQRRRRSGSAAANPVQGGGLTSLLIHRHLRQQVVDALFDWRFGIFVNIHPAVLVQIDPTLAIDLVFIVGLILRRMEGRLY